MSEVRDVTTWYLEMRAVSQLRPARMPGVAHRIERVEQPSAAFARSLYATVGRDHYWVDRLPWPAACWDERLQTPGVHLYTLEVDGAPAGYFELEQQLGGHVQIIYFGLRREHRGQGLGGALLTRAVQLAWQLEDAERVWVHTCSLDGPHALANYRARGFVTFRQKTEAVELVSPDGPWPEWDSPQG